MKKSFVFLVVFTLAVLSFAGGLFASSWGTYEGFPIAKLVLNGQAAETASPPIVINGRTYVPLRFISESLGAKVSWDQENYAVKIDLTSQPATTPPSPQPSAIPKTASVTVDGVTIASTSVQVTSTATIISLKISNNSTSAVDFAASLSQLVVGSTQFDKPTEYDNVFISDIKPGVVKEGKLEFPVLPSGSNFFKLYLKALNNEKFDVIDFALDLSL